MPAVYGPFLRPFGQEATIDFALYDRGGGDFDGGIIGAIGDTRLVCDESPPVNTANFFVNNNGGGYALVLTPQEMQCMRGTVYVVDQSNPKLWIDAAIIFETYGSVNAQHPSIGNAAVVPVPIGG